MPSALRCHTCNAFCFVRYSLFLILSLSLLFCTVVAICSFSALIDLRQHYTYVYNANGFLVCWMIYLKYSCHTLLAFQMVLSTINYKINYSRPMHGFGSKIIVMLAYLYARCKQDRLWTSIFHRQPSPLIKHEWRSFSWFVFIPMQKIFLIVCFLRTLF